MSIMIWSTADCNMKCKYCYEGDNKSKLYMSEKTRQKVVDYVENKLQDYDNDTFLIGLHGGEPFLNFECLEFLVSSINNIANIIGKKVTFVTTTNATLLNDRICKFIIQNIPDITVSLEGSRATQNKMRPFKNGMGSYDIAMKNSLKLLKELPNLRVRMTFDTETVGELFNNIIHLVEKGFKCIVPIPNYYDNWRDEHLIILEDQINSLKRLNYNKCVIGLLEPVSTFEKARCNGGLTSEHIYPNGDIYPCSLTCGNRNYCIGDIWHGINQDKLNSIHTYTSTCNKVCNGCTLEKNCDGNRCKLVNKQITGDYLTPPPMLCQLKNLQFRLNN